MLNAELVENFHAIYRQKQTGSLNASGEDFNLRFLFQEGEVMAMDMGEDKEHLLADKLQEYHRLDAAQHALVFATRERVQGNVADIVKQLRLASDDEVTQITRAMVEDVLCHAFGGKVRHLQFNPAQGIESFNFDRSAVRLRIGVDMLLKTVDTRVAEIQEVRKAVGEWDSIFAFAEGSEDAGALTDYEKHVLNFVDGHRTVDDIASACRDSCLNLARVLFNLVKKGVIRKLPSKQKSGTGPAPATSQSGQSPQAGPSASSSPSAASAPAPVAPSPQTYTNLPPQPAEASRGRGMLVVLVALLLLVLGVFAVVIQYNEKQKRIKEMQDQVAELVGKRDWNEALRKIEDLKTQAGSDLSALETINVISASVQAEMTKELETVRKLVDAGDFEDARKRLNRLPAEMQTDVRRHLLLEEEAFNQASGKLATEVGAQLENGDVAAANRLIGSRPARESAAAALVLDRWRIKKLEEARPAGASIEDRQKAVKLVRDASPSPDQLQTIAMIEDDIRRQEGRLRDQIKQLQEMADIGKYDEALTRAEKLGTGSVVKGNAELEKAFQAFQTKCDKVKSEFDQFHEDVRSAIASGDSSDRLKELSGKGELLLKSYPGAPRHDETDELVSLLKDLVDAVTQPADVQPALIAGMMEARKVDQELTAALKSRMNRLSSNEAEANVELENSRRLLKDGNWDAAERHLQDLIRKPEWQATAAHRAAEKDLADARSQNEHRQAAQKDLTAAIAAGDVSKANTIAREIGLKYLPLSIESVPSNAEVWQGGKKIGATPMVIDIPAADRVDYAIELRLPGYLPKSAAGASAEGGWRLIAALERAPAAHADLGQIVTSRPTAIGARIWVCNRQQAFAINPAGNVESFSFQAVTGASPLNNPIYAQVVSSEDGIYIPTREGIAVRVGKAVDRMPLNGATDFALAIYESPELIDRRFLITAGIDGMLHGVDERHPTSRWDAASGAPFAAAPVIANDRVLAVRTDGALEAVQAYNGKPLGGDAIGAPVVAAWVVPGKGFAGLTANESWSWDGTAITREPLPQVAVGGAKDVLVGVNGRIWLHSGAEWKDMGRVDGNSIGQPLAWQGHVAVPVGSTMRVLGPRGFAITQSADFLPAVAVGPRLVVINQNGQVSIFNP